MIRKLRKAMYRHDRDLDRDAPVRSLGHRHLWDASRKGTRRTKTRRPKTS